MQRVSRRLIIAILIATTTSAVSWTFVYVPHQPLGRYLIGNGIAWLVAGIMTLTIAFVLTRYHERLASQLLLVGALLPVILVLRDQLAQLVLVGLLGIALFLSIRRQYTSTHIIDASFLLIACIVVIAGTFEYIGFRLSLIDARYEKAYAIVLERTVAMTLVWLAGLALATLWARVAPRLLRLAGFILWALLFLLVTFIWMIDVSILYYSGLHIGPSALEHLAGAEEVVAGNELWITIGAFIVVAVLLCLTLWRYTRVIRTTPPSRKLTAVFVATIILAIGIVSGTQALRDSGEDIVVRSFIDYYFGEAYVKTLDPVLAEKLKKFGLTYHPDAFLVSTHERVYDKKAPAPKLAERFTKKRPNVLIIFFESFSSRLTSVYNERFPGLTPALELMARDKHTTVFNNLYNASTPTETGMLADLCSFLPPTGHGEIVKNGALTRHQLLCLPEALKTQGYGSTFYMTGVESTYASKDKLFKNAGIDTVYGREYWKTAIGEEPKSWGYSDHQLFPQLLPMMERTATGDRPFFGMMTTIDSHPPFYNSKDRVPYRDNKNLVLNAFYSTDHAFQQFWTDFKASPLAENTIVIAIADHAVFPTVTVKELFSEEAKTLGFYDEILFMMYMPESSLPKTVNTIASSIDLVPTLLHILGINIPNSFEGLSIFGDRRRHPNIVGIHELGLFINQENREGGRDRNMGFLKALRCPRPYRTDPRGPLTMCDLNEFYEWKRTMLNEGRLWKPRKE